MIKQLYLLAFALLLSLFSCTNEPSSTTANTTDDIAVTTTEDFNSKIGRSNYAVVWKWTTDDIAFVSSNSVQISNELQELWKQDIVENAYYDPAPKADKLANFPGIFFFLKAKNENAAKQMLDKLTVVTKEIASYELYPVGQLWLNRNTEAIQRKKLTRSFAAVWTTEQSPTDNNMLLQEQSDAVMKLWNQGNIENVYLNIQGVAQKNDKTDFVFFANTNSEEEAKQLCESLPFFKAGIATYQLFSVGVFWLGKAENK